MNKRMTSSKRLFAFICVILILAYATVVYLPGFHECVGRNCAICAVTELLRNILFGSLLTVAIYRSLDVLRLTVNDYKHIPVEREYTPVGLKVKLSD